MSHTFIQDPQGAEALSRELADAPRFALDCEAAGFHRYSDRLCLIQITTARDTYVVDPLAMDPTELLRGPVEDPDTEVVMHGADFDLRLLDRDLDLQLRGLFDTQIAAQLVGERSLGLQALLENHLGVKLAKKYQRADWAKRPLKDEMLEYAANDTRHLVDLADVLAEKLRGAGRTAWAEEENRALEAYAVADDGQDVPEDPVTRVKGARDLSARQITALREALRWRDDIARERDRALFRVVGDKPLLEAVARKPLNVSDLSSIKGFPGRLAHEEGRELLRRLDAVATLPDDELEPYPKPTRSGPGRPPPEVEAAASRLKSVRNRKADELGLDRGVLISNAVLTQIAWDEPADAEELVRVEGVHRWQVEALGPELLAALNGKR